MLGQYLKAERERAGLSQEAVAAKAQISREYLSQLERDAKVPTVGVLIRLAAALGTTGWKLLRRAEEKS